VTEGPTPSGAKDSRRWLALWALGAVAGAVLGFVIGEAIGVTGLFGAGAGALVWSGVIAGLYYSD